MTPSIISNLARIRQIPGTAIFSEDRKYRYMLTREWDEGDNPLILCMCNPSTADEKILDPTVYKCLWWSIMWGYNRLIVINSFAYRATNVKEIYKVEDPIGPKNDFYTKLTFEWCKASIGSKVIMAAGNNGLHLNRLYDIKKLAKQVGIDLYYMKLTDKGIPCHPLYLKKTLTPQLWMTNED